TEIAPERSIASASMTVTGPTPEIWARLMRLPVTVTASMERISSDSVSVVADWAMDVPVAPAYSREPIAMARIERLWNMKPDSVGKDVGDSVVMRRRCCHAARRAGTQ